MQNIEYDSLQRKTSELLCIPFQANNQKLFWLIFLEHHFGISTLIIQKNKLIVDKSSFRFIL